MKLPPLFPPKHEKGYRLKHHDPMRQRLRQAFLALVVILLGWGMYELGFAASGYQTGRLQVETSRLHDRVKYLEGQNRDLLQKVASLSSSNKIATQSSSEVKQTLTQLENQISDLKEELAFYKSIVSPSKMQPGLHVQNLSLETGDGSGEYAYSLVLTQVRGAGLVARGSADISLVGMLNGAQTTLDLSKLTGGDQKRLKFSFKYFQSIDGNIKLPVGFEPQKIEVRVRPSSRRLDSIDRDYDWAKTLNGNK
ncbi:MAG: hypothetical protein P8Y64_01455 [Gammaproteobacteria bacterium]